MISVLIPERGRPAMLARCIASLLETSTGDDRVEILVAVDDDDPEWEGRDLPVGPRVRAWRWPRPLTLGEKLNALAAQATGSIVWFIANDYVMETVGWPDRFRAAVDHYPNGIGVAFPHDDLHRDHAAFPIFTKKMIETIGFMFAPCYGIGWFIDTTVDEYGILLGYHQEIDVTVRAPEGRGKTHGMHDLAFWVDAYKAFAPLRLREGIQLITAAYGEGSPAFQNVMADIGRRQQICAARVAHLSSPEFLARWGASAESPPHPQYATVKAHAEKMMADIKAGTPRRPRVAIAVPSGRTWDATTANCVAALTAYTTQCNIEICALNVQSSAITHGRNTTVEIALQQNCTHILWIDSDLKIEPNTLQELMKHGKDICGATYNKRVHPYSTLGRLKGPRPSADELRGGIIEAEALPGGLLLVNIDVYKNTRRPWYFEAYRWDVKDGFEAFRTMMNEYFRFVPPPEALDELAGTQFGMWLRDHFEVGLDPGIEDRYISEDLAWCRKVRRAGYEIWCSLDVTFKTAHIGSQEITCDRPPPSAPPVVAPAVAEAMKTAAD